MNRVVHFEIPAEDPENVARFYSEVFNWKIEKWEGPVDYWLITTGEENEPGINGAISMASDLTINRTIFQTRPAAETAKQLTVRPG